MARIGGVEDSKTGWFVRFVYRLAQKRLGKVPDPLRVMSHHRRLFKGYGGFEFALERSRLVQSKIKVLAEIKTSALIGCPW